MFEYLRKGFKDIQNYGYITNYKCPTGIKIFSWIRTCYGGSVRYTAAMVFALGLDKRAQVI